MGRQKLFFVSSEQHGRHQSACSGVDVLGEGVSGGGVLTEERKDVWRILCNVYCQIRYIRGDKKDFSELEVVANPLRKPGKDRAGPNAL